MFIDIGRCSNVYAKIIRTCICLTEIETRNIILNFKIEIWWKICISSSLLLEGEIPVRSKKNCYESR